MEELAQQLPRKQNHSPIAHGTSLLPTLGITRLFAQANAEHTENERVKGEEEGECERLSIAGIVSLS